MNFDLERALRHKKNDPNHIIAGVDEAGRGPWAGPVVAGAAIFPPHADISALALTGLTDSKKLAQPKRDVLYARLIQLSKNVQSGVAVGIGLASVDEIDTLNILQASLKAMQRAVAALACTPHHILVDGRHLPLFDMPATAIIRGDSHSLSIAAGSVLAKVARDQLMTTLDRQYPIYRWSQNKGYGTPAHKLALAKNGPSPHHRKSFAPIAKLLAKNIA